MGTTLVTGAGLVGTSFGQCALRRGEKLVFFDAQPRREFLQTKLGKGNFEVVQKDVRDLPAIIQAIQDHKAATLVHTAGLIGPRVAESLYTGFHINVVGTMNVAEAVRLTGVKRLVHVSTFGVYDWRRPAPKPVTEDFFRGSGVPYGNSKVAKELLLEAYI
jgi:nucleoside-diphosphate-sugar epimerase